MQATGAQQRFFDALAIGASALCLLHCIALPAVLLLLPALAAILIVPEAFHLAALVFAVPTSAAALLAGYRGHRRLLPAIIAGPGTVLLALGALLGDGASETVLTISGALLLSVAHVLNWRALPRLSRAR